jgi:hypothetical protein
MPAEQQGLRIMHRSTVRGTHDLTGIAALLTRIPAPRRLLADRA